ncbi:PREDICTED: uncharacterized protein LOC106327840 isoform X2 [Brassica oleracea var. oleracea]|uniref:uncharacterized protein LOC106327840 isoform X2 n=1 Tax=Brassica oleracea var. oleracea TaxID=109376 RepID=UPI0006A6E86F|nr:PREDICTED: uncharacterized protein LOC106327840 isoform X2 [Brassica oleracea var. oleracea]
MILGHLDATRCFRSVLGGENEGRKNQFEGEEKSLMGGSDENKHGVIGPMNPQGGLRGGKVNPANGQTRRALSNINKNIIGAPVYPCAVNKRPLFEKNVMCNKKIPPPVPVHRPITRKFAAQLAENNPQTKKEVVMTMRTQGGDEAVLHLLNRTRELYRRRIQETTIVDQLDSIFVECAITEAQPLGHEPTSSTDLNGTRERVTADAHGNSIWRKAYWCSNM